MMKKGRVANKKRAVTIHRRITGWLILIFLLTFSIQAKAEDHATAQEGSAEAFDLKEMIFSHVMDAYEWHFFTFKGHHYSLPLPIIVKSPDRGWFVFSSARLAHEESYAGFYIATAGDYKGKVVEKNGLGQEIRPFDISFTKTALFICFACVLLLLIFVPLAKGYKEKPLRSRRGFAGAIEMLTVSIVDDLIKPCIGHGYKLFAPYLLTAFYFIFLNNLLGLIPVGINVTGNIAITLVLAMFTFVITQVFGNKEYWKEIFWPDVPVLLKAPVPIMPVVELLGIFTKPFALTVRLFANMLAGHIVILVLVGLIFIFKAMEGAAFASAVSLLSIAFSIFMLALDVLISFIQAYVFTMLSSIFIGLARPEHSH